MIYPKRSLALVLVLVASATACKSSKSESDLLARLANLDKEEIFDQAEQLYSEKEYQRARELFSFVYDTFPNDPLGHKAALRVADTYSIKKDVTNLTEARLRYRDFANRYPNDPDRDLSDIQEALGAYQQLINLYPNSEYLSDASDRVNGLRELLAEHEWGVADFYRKNRYYLGALWRLEYIRDNYPNYSQIALVKEQIGEIETLIEEREAAWKKRLEELKKDTED